MTLRPAARRARRARAPIAAALGLAVIVSGCSGDGETAGPTDPAPGTEATGAGSTAPEEFTGHVDDFYVVPDPLPAGEPGELIRVQEVGATEDGSATVRVMYHSRDAEDRDRAVTGIVTYPTGPAPDGGWPVVSWAHGTTGLASRCAPSRAGDAAPAFGVEGVRVATDYVGLGPVGEIHPYLSRASEGNSVIDAVRAARQLPAAHAGRRWLAVGHSQGGHGALSAHELAGPYAPELELVGTVALAPASDFDRTFGGIDQIVARVVGAMALYGAAGEHPEIDPADYVGPQLAAAAEVIRTQCLDEIIAAVAGIPGGDDFYRQDPRETEPARSLLLANEVGEVSAEAPLLLVSGTIDDRVVIDRVRSLYRRLCDVGQVTELVVVDGAGHGDIIPRTAEQVEAWLTDRLAGDPATDSCVVAP
ncbi:MAG: lipase family protein [Acidimicrobiales bacterium]